MRKVGVISESLEDYLEIIFRLLDEKGIARVKDISLRKEVSMASVNSALKRLFREDLIKYQSRGIVQLTPEGRELAMHVINRHEFMKDFLVSILEVPSEIAEKDACSFEHSMSIETFRKLVGFFEFVNTCELDIRDRFRHYCKNIENPLDRDFCGSPTCPHRKVFKRFRHRWDNVKTLNSLKPGEKGRVAQIRAKNVVRQRLIDMGVLPNVEITMERVAPLGDPIEVKLRGYHLSLRKEEAESIVLQPVKS